MRELLPVGAAAGAAAVAVTLIVGGTTAELVSPAQQGPWPVATSPAPADLPSVITNTPAPRRNERARSSAGAPFELAAGPATLVTGPLAARPTNAGADRTARAGGGGARRTPLGPEPTPAAELAGPVVVPVAAPAVPVALAEPAVVTAAATSARPGRSGTAPGQTRKAAPAVGPTTEAPAPATFSASDSSSDDTVDPPDGNTGPGRGHGREWAPGQAREADGPAGHGRSKAR